MMGASSKKTVVGSGTTTPPPPPLPPPLPQAESKSRAMAGTNIAIREGSLNGPGRRVDRMV
jgi:hypothetical protein